MKPSQPITKLTTLTHDNWINHIRDQEFKQAQTIFKNLKSPHYIQEFEQAQTQFKNLNKQTIFKNLNSPEYIQEFTATT